MATKIDRLGVSTKEGQEGVRRFLSGLFGQIAEPHYEVRRGAHGFESAALVTVGGANVAWWGWGGASQKGRAYVDVTGLGCGLVEDWARAQEAVGELQGARLTRVDIAADFYRGEVTIADVLRAYKRGKFTGRGRPPKLERIVPGDPADGETANIGRGGDVMLCAYEKGKKEFQGLPDWMRQGGAGVVTGQDDDGRPFTLDEWVRLELRLRSKKRPVPFDVIGDRDQYFAGAYPYLQEVMPDVTPEVLVRPQHIAEANLAKALEHIRRQYGSTLFTALTIYGGDVAEVMRRIVGKHHNENLLHAGAVLHGDTFACLE